MKPELVRVNILGTGVHAINYAMALDEMEDWIQRRDPHYVCVTPVHSLIACYQDPILGQIVNRSGLTTPDGMPLVWTLKARGFRDVTRVYGPDLLLVACEASISSNRSHYFLGGYAGVCQRLVKSLEERFPGLRVAGWEEPPFRSMSADEDFEMCDRIRQVSPDYLWIGLGSPRQEYWMSDHIDRLDVPVLIGVGAAFDFLSGAKPQASKWMQRSGLEWFFRLANEPGRLWKRYLTSNPLFIWLSFLQWTGLKRFPMN